MSVEQRQKLSALKKGKAFSAEHKLALQAAHLGKKLSAEHAEAIRHGQKNSSRFESAMKEQSARMRDWWSAKRALRLQGAQLTFAVADERKNHVGS